MIEDYAHIQRLADEDVEVLRDKGRVYGSSWRKRGGAGAFMMLARKWDRLEKQCEEHGYDIFELILTDVATADVEGILDDIRDLRRYLFLVDSYVTQPKCCSNPAVTPGTILYTGTDERSEKEELWGGTEHQ